MKQLILCTIQSFFIVSGMIYLWSYSVSVLKLHIVHGFVLAVIISVLSGVLLTEFVLYLNKKRKQ